MGRFTRPTGSVCPNDSELINRVAAKIEILSMRFVLFSVCKIGILDAFIKTKEVQLTYTGISLYKSKIELKKIKKRFADFISAPYLCATIKVLITAEVA